jgi:N-acetylglucosamine-6-phosphate deacetylase
MAAFPVPSRARWQGEIMERFAIVGARLFTGADMLDDRALIVAGGRVEEIIAADRVPADLPQTVLAPDRVVAPGFIDIQVNGGGGVLFNDAPTIETIRTIFAAHRRFGTTGFLPTLISDRPEVTRKAMDAARRALAAREPGVLGIHIEGPHFAEPRRGVHQTAMLRPMNDADQALLCKDIGGVVLTTVDPDVVTPTQIASLARAGVRVFLGHSDASFDTVRAALDAGACGFTHLTNAMSGMVNRAPGMIGAAIDDRASWCGLIVDGHHVHPAVLRIAVAAKPRGKCVLVTDAMPPVGTDIKEFVLYGQTIRVTDGRLVARHDTLAGAVLDMASAVRNTVRLLGQPLEEALRMAAAYPADVLGMSDSRGRLLRGYHADIVVLDPELRVERTWIGGRA